MTVWHLELLRLYRTRRWAALLIIFVLIGILGPLFAFLLPHVLPHVGSGIQITVTPANATDGINDFAQNATDLGMLFTLIIAAGVVSIDANPGIAVFYRSRRFRIGNLLFPRYFVIAGASICSLAVGTLICWLETVILLGSVSFGALMEGLLLEAIYMAFAIALVTMVAAILRSTIPTVATSVAVLLLVPTLALIPHLQPALPSTLLSSYVALVKQTTDFGNYAASGVLTLTATIVLLYLAVFFTERPQQPHA